MKKSIKYVPKLCLECKFDCVLDLTKGQELLVCRKHRPKPKNQS